MPSTKRGESHRCGHFEQAKVGLNWKCVACGRVLTIAESAQNSLELSEVLRSAIDSRRNLSESLDDLYGRREWEAIRANIPASKIRGRREK